MCTAATYKTKCHYFGRNLDYHISYGESVVVTPRNHPFEFRRMGRLDHHYALIGMATLAGDVPLYFDATNEKGLSMAGLNFPKNACYKPEVDGKDNVAPFEFIPWILGQCACVKEARPLLDRINLIAEPFSEQLPLAPLHWIIADRDEAIVVEQMQDGLKVYDNPVGILTNNPPFDYHMHNLNNYLNVTADVPVSRFAPDYVLERHSLGMGSMGLPGDMSSPSRFVRAAFTKLNSFSGEDESGSVSQFFHILESVAQPRGCTCVGEGEYEYTLYTSCVNTDTGVFYYTTYENGQINAVDMHREDLDGNRPVSYPLLRGQHFNVQN